LKEFKLQELFDTILFILKEGYIVLAIVLWLFYRFSSKHSALAKELLHNLGWLMVVICMWIITNWALDLAEYYSDFSESEYEQYAFTKRLLGEYGWVYWFPFLMVVGVLLLNFFKKFRTNLIVLLLGIIICYGSYYYTFFQMQIASNRSFISSSWHLELPVWYKIVLAFILNTAICLLLISIPKIYKLLCKQ
jgi:uncharacterized protein YacL